MASPDQAYATAGRDLEGMTRDEVLAIVRAKAALAAAEHDLLEKAKDESPPEFRKRLERFIAENRADDGLADHDRQKARASLRFWNDSEGMKRMTGTFDPDLGATIEHEVRRKSEEAWRAERAGRDESPAPQSVITHERRMAEALGDICRRSAGADVRDGKRVPPRAGVTMTYDNLMGTDDSPAERADGSPMPAAVARKMACQAGIVPIVLGGESVPLDWGRARRFASPQQGDALRLWYDTCTLFGCTAKVEWCDAHHIEPFEPSGLTNLDNLTPACDHCHDLVHRPGWGVKKDNHGVVTSWAPDGQTWTHHPRDRRQRRERPTQPQPAAAPEYQQSVLV